MFDLFQDPSANQSPSLNISPGNYSNDDPLKKSSITSDQKKIKDELSKLWIPPKKNPWKKAKILLAALGVFLLVVTVPATVYLIEQRQEIRTSAIGCCSGDGTVCCSNDQCEAGWVCYSHNAEICSNGRKYKCDSNKSCGQQWVDIGSCGNPPGNEWCETVNDCAQPCKGSKVTMRCNPNTDKQECGSSKKGCEMFCDENRNLEWNSDYSDCVCKPGYSWNGSTCVAGGNCEGQSCKVEHTHGPDNSVSGTWLSVCRSLQCTCEQGVLAERCSISNPTYIKTFETSGKIDSLCSYQKTIDYQGQKIDCSCFAYQADWYHKDSNNNKVSVGWHMAGPTKNWDECIAGPILSCTNIRISTINNNEVNPKITPTPEPKINDRISFACEGGYTLNNIGPKPHHFEFRYRINNGEWQSLAQEDMGPSDPFQNPPASWTGVSQELTVSTGDYTIQCRVCSQETSCTPWEELVY